MHALLLALALVGPPVPSPAPPGTPVENLAPAPRHIGPAWYAFAVGGQVADVVTTSRFRGRGFVEQNDRLRGLSAQPVALGAIKVALAVGITAGASEAAVRIERTGRPNMARFIRLAPVVVGAWGFAAAIHNERLHH